MLRGSSIADFEHNAYRERVKILRNLITRDCQKKKTNQIKREITAEISKVKGDVEKVLNERMERLLIECRRTANIKITDTTVHAVTNAAYPSTLTTTSGMTTEPEECQGAINLTENWRQDNKGRRLRGGNVKCDTKPMIARGRPWFRFAGAAGNMMLNSCPPDNSCGTHGGIWTNHTMPTAIGVPTNVTAYISFAGCYRYPVSLIAMRCSNRTNNSFIYKYVDDFQGCSYAFCGMNGLN